MPDPVSDPDPTDPTKDQDPTHAEAAQNSASDEHELTDEQVEKAAGGFREPAGPLTTDGLGVEPCGIPPERFRRECPEQRFLRHIPAETNTDVY